jgi:LmbE family N-acetylglucosaminyl deacetylase
MLGCRIAAIVRELRPRTVILQWQRGRHPDHTAASQLAHDACFVAGLKRAAIGLEPHRPKKVIYALSFREDVVKPTFVVDITEQMDRKIEAVFAYGSQFENKTSMGEIFGGGDRPLRDQILAHAAHYGSLIRRPFGEPFYTHETMMVDDIVALEVPSI